MKVRYSQYEVTHVSDDITKCFEAYNHESAAEKYAEYYHNNSGEYWKEDDEIEVLVRKLDEEEIKKFSVRVSYHPYFFADEMEEK